MKKNIAEMSHLVFDRLAQYYIDVVWTLGACHLAYADVERPLPSTRKASQ